jgi:UDP-GlcNAc:undecaprenyl-phosphate/decaprenyl-phosphate GlcNAc-1-phosphate transferase
LSIRDPRYRPSVQSLPLALSFLAALLVAPAMLRSLREQGFVRENYRGAEVAFPAGIAIVVSALLALIVVAPLDKIAGLDIFRPESRDAFIYVIGVALLGLLDDLVGSGALRPPGAAQPAPPGTDPPGSAAAAAPAGPAPRGWRGHASATLGGAFSTGAAKAAGSLALALFVLAGTGLDGGEYLLAVGLLVLATNLFNLLDLRPGRSIKALLLLALALTLGTFDLDPLWALGLFVGPILVLLPLDLREVGMLGDAGSNVVGAVAGLWLVLTLSTTGQAIALALIAVATVYGEFRSISALVERTPLLRHLDSLGRPTSHA